MKLSLLEILKQNDFDEEQIDPRILQLVNDIHEFTDEGRTLIHVPDLDNFISHLSKRYKLNPRNRQEGGIISAVLVYMEIISPQEAFGDPNTYQEISNLLRRGN